MADTVVKRYKGNGKYQKDVKKMTKQGYRVIAVSDQGRPSWYEFGHARRILVTYAKD